MKRIIALLLAMTMVLAFTACGAKAPQQPATGSDVPEVETPATPENNEEDNQPAVMPEEPSTDDQPADMPEEPSVDDQPATMPEEPAVDDQPATMPEEPAVDDQPATMPEEPAVDDQPATMPEEPSVDDQPATMPEEPSVDDQPEQGDDSAPNEAVLNELYAMIDSINAGVELPMVGSMALDAEMFPYFAFIDKPAGVEAVVSEAMIGSIAHSLVLFKCADGVDVNAIASQVQANANPRKWVCVEAEKTVVVVKGSYVLLVMSNTVAADALVANFNSL